MKAAAAKNEQLSGLGKVVLGVLVGIPGIFVLGVLLFLRSPDFLDRHIIHEAYEQRLAPAAEWIRQFTALHGRLPTDEELTEYSQQRFGNAVGIYRKRPPKWNDEWLTDWPESDREFLLIDGISGSNPSWGWNLYYCSWNNRRVPIWTD